MPNWTTNHLVITGKEETLNQLIAQVSKPYTTQGEDYSTTPSTTKTIEVNEPFQFWNIISPTDLETYHQQRVWTPKDNAEPLDTDNVVSQFYEDMATKDDWYNWNLRNWGTKWDVTDALLAEHSKNKLLYVFYTAWSPPAEAIDHLAKQYPTLTFSMKSIDEGDMYACELGWNDGVRVVEMDLPITHEINMELRGSCWGCDEDMEFDDDDDEVSNRVKLGCDVADDYAAELNKEK